MRWIFVFLGILFNSAGLLVFGRAVTHQTMAGGAMAAGFWDGLFGLLLINAGICLIVLGLRRSSPS